MKRNHYLIIGAFIVISLIVFKCSNDRAKELKGEYNILKEQYEKKKKEMVLLEENRKKEADSLTKENQKLKEQRDKANQKIEVLLADIDRRKKQGDKDRDRIAKLEHIEVANELNNIYNTKNAVATTESVNLKNDLGNKVLQTVYDEKECQDISLIKDNVIKEKDTVISTLNGEIKNKDILLTSANKSIEGFKDLNEQASDNIKNLEKQIKKKNTSNFILKYIVVPSAVIGGFLLGSQK